MQRHLRGQIPDVVTIGVGNEFLEIDQRLAGFDDRLLVADESVGAVGIGRALRDARTEGRDAIAAIAPLCGARRLFTGKVVVVP